MHFKLLDLKIGNASPITKNTLKAVQYYHQIISRIKVQTHHFQRKHAITTLKSEGINTSMTEETKSYTWQIYSTNVLK